MKWNSKFEWLILNCALKSRVHSTLAYSIATLPTSTTWVKSILKPCNQRLASSISSLTLRLRMLIRTYQHQLSRSPSFSVLPTSLEVHPRLVLDSSSCLPIPTIKNCSNPFGNLSRPREDLRKPQNQNPMLPSRGEGITVKECSSGILYLMRRVFLFFIVVVRMPRLPTFLPSSLQPSVQEHTHGS